MGCPEWFAHLPEVKVSSLTCKPAPWRRPARQLTRRFLAQVTAAMTLAFLFLHPAAASLGQVEKPCVDVSREPGVSGCVCSVTQLCARALAGCYKSQQTGCLPGGAAQEPRVKQTPCEPASANSRMRVIFLPVAASHPCFLFLTPLVKSAFLETNERSTCMLLI